MNLILDRFVPSKPAFRPKTQTELFALRLARKLGEAPAARHFVSLAGNYSETQLLNAYHRTLHAEPAGDLARRFHLELQQIHANGSSNGQSTNLMAVRVERRSVAVVIFHGTHSEYTQVRQLSSAHGKALESAVNFVNWVANHFRVDSSALETIPNGHEFQRTILHDALIRTLRDRVLPVWEVAKTELFEGYGHPSLRSRKELREVAITIWPILAGTNTKVFIQDAAVLGLYVQVERLFLN
jgi:hypothetical protein